MTDEEVLVQAATLIAEGRQAEATKLLSDRHVGRMVSPELTVQLGYLLIEQRRPREASALLARASQLEPPDLGMLTAYATALKAEGRTEEAVSIYRQAATQFPQQGVAEHNLGAALADIQSFEEAERATSRAIVAGLEAPETWLVRARALQGLASLDNAERAYRQAISRRRNFAEAHAGLADLIWSRSGDFQLAASELRLALGRFPGDPGLTRVLAKLLEQTGRRTEAYELVVQTLSRPDGDPTLNVEAAQLSSWHDGAVALAHAEVAFAAFPERGDVLAALCEANLAIGRPDIALQLVDRLRTGWPLDQYAVALQATAWRLIGDPRYRDLFNYADLILSEQIDTPRGWSSIASYLADLSQVLQGLQTSNAHPIGQSVRHGVQTGRTLTHSENPVIQAFFIAVDSVIPRQAEAMKHVDAILGRETNARYRIASAWSVLLRPGGFHQDHLHPLGWISSAFHVSLPAAVEVGHEGWLRFGEPGIATHPALEAEHFVKPEAGRLILFPSYMWHGTIPFRGTHPRLTVAFDVLPG